MPLTDMLFSLFLLQNFGNIVWIIVLIFLTKSLIVHSTLKTHFHISVSSKLTKQNLNFPYFIEMNPQSVKWQISGYCIITNAVGD